MYSIQQHSPFFSQRGNRMQFIPRISKLFVAFAWVALAQTGVWADEPSPDYINQNQDAPQSDGHSFQSNTREYNRIAESSAKAGPERTTFQNVKTWSSFRNAALREAVFNESSFVGVDFRDADLEMARFIKCVLPAARLLGANCRQISFTKRAKTDERTNGQASRLSLGVHVFPTPPEESVN